MNPELKQTSLEFCYLCVVRDVANTVGHTIQTLFVFDLERSRADQSSDPIPHQGPNPE